MEKTKNKSSQVIENEQNKSCDCLIITDSNHHKKSKTFCTFKCPKIIFCFSVK